MDNWFDENQGKRRKKANRSSRQDRGRIRKRNLANKKRVLVLDSIGDSHPNDGVRNVQCMGYLFNSQISTRSNYNDDEYIETMIIETCDNLNKFQFSSTTAIETSQEQINDLVLWIIDKPLNVTAFQQNIYECYEATPRDGSSIRSDLEKLTNNPPSQIFEKIIHCLQAMPYLDKSFHKYGKLSQSIQKFMSEYKLTFNQEQLLHQRRVHILHRYSFGFLFVHHDKFFVAPHRNGGECRRIIKGHPSMKVNDTFETAWETAVRVTAKQLEYQNDEKNGEWDAFDINQYKNEWIPSTYLECAFEEAFSERYQRLMGIFVIHLLKTIKFRVKDYEYHQDKCQWISFDTPVNKENFYTAYPFIKYFKSNPHLLSN
ncbi:unnamed protein product [Rotaria sordida]|uniref:Uncharacterized protein n=2 Tax=Rotaria sordida TaxID=392033 RepID=A0A815CZZ7_9BILA|nr:unnamed protein product [Rotaria sordida]CAF1290572.1 unnamed protein product [Rotaria sordida]